MTKGLILWTDSMGPKRPRHAQISIPSVIRGCGPLC